MPVIALICYCWLMQYNIMKTCRIGRGQYKPVGKIRSVVTITSTVTFG